MKKHLLITFSFITLHIHAMEMEVETSKQSSAPCWFIGLPTDIMDFIADLIFYEIEETEQEFIKRTKALTFIREIPVKYLDHLPSYSIYDHEYLYSVQSSDDKLIALLYKGADKIGKKEFKPSPTLLIINKKNNQLLHIKDLDNDKEFLNIAIPRDGNRIGTLRSQSYLQSVTHKTFSFKRIVTITNLITTKIQTYEIPNYFELSHKHPTIAFNKQGTHIIIHGNNNDKLYHSPLSFDEIEKNPIRHHILIPLTQNTPNPNADNKKTLARYFVQQGICKDLNKQLALTQ